MPQTEDSVSGQSGASIPDAFRRQPCVPGINNFSIPEQPINDRLITAVALIKGTLKCEAVGIRLIDEDGNATYQVQDGFPDAFSAACQSVSLYRDDCVCTRLLNSKSGPGATYFNEREPFMAGSACEFRSVLLCRIFCMDMNLGLIHCADTRPHRFSPRSAQFLEDLAETIGRSLFYDSLWEPASWVGVNEQVSSRVVCSICGRYRDNRGRWFAERRRKPRISWSVLRIPRVICPHCLQFSAVE